MYINTDHLIATVPVKKKFPLRSSKTLQSRFRVGKKTLNDLKKTATFFYAPEFFCPTVVYFLLIYANLTICAENLFCSAHFLQGLLKQQLFLLFGFFVASLFVSGCIQTFTSASHCCRFHCRQPLRHSLSPVTAFSFSHYCFSCRHLAIQFRLPVAVVGFLVVFFCFIAGLSFVHFSLSSPSSACHSFLLQLLIANVDSLSS